MTPALDIADEIVISEGLVPSVERDLLTKIASAVDDARREALKLAAEHIRTRDPKVQLSSHMICRLHTAALPILAAEIEALVPRG